METIDNRNIMLSKEEYDKLKEAETHLNILIGAYNNSKYSSEIESVCGILFGAKAAVRIPVPELNSVQTDA